MSEYSIRPFDANYELYELQVYTLTLQLAESFPESLLGGPAVLLHCIADNCVMSFHITSLVHQ